MAKIVDPDQLNDATEIVVSTAAKTIQLLVAGNLNDDSPGKSSGATVQAVYSKVKELWKSNTSYNKLSFPFDPGAADVGAKLRVINGWDWADAQTRDLLRDSGWREEKNNDEYISVISLGAVDASTVDQAYYVQVFGFDQTTATFDKKGELNEGLSVYDGSTAGDYRDFLKVLLREPAKLYAEYDLLNEQDLLALTYQAYRLPLSNAADINITLADGVIDASTDFAAPVGITYLKGNTFGTYATASTYPAEAVAWATTSVSSTADNGRWFFTLTGGTASSTDGPSADVGIADWESYVGERQVGTIWYAFNRIVEADGNDLASMYNWTQRQLRKASDINANATMGSTAQDDFGTVNGNIARLLVEYVGATLKTFPGVYIDSFDVNDQNSIAIRAIEASTLGLDAESVPLQTSEITFPFVSAGTITFSTNIVNEPTTETLYRMYFDYTHTETRTDLQVTGGSTTSTGALLSPSTGLNLTLYSTAEYIRIGGFTEAGNNGLFYINSAASTKLGIQRYDGSSAIATEVAGDTVVLRSDPFDTPDAIVVLDNNSSAIEGQVTSASIAFSFDYDNNVQGSHGGRASGVTAPVTIVAQALDGAQWVSGSFSITNQTGLTFPLNPANETVYSNP